MILLLNLDAGFRNEWNQAAINKALSSYHESSSEKEIICEELWCLIRGEVLFILGKKLKGDIVIEEAEFAALRDFKRRLKKGSIKFLTKKYVAYICDTAVRFVLSRRIKINPIGKSDSGKSKSEKSTFFLNPENLPKIHYADLYFCLEKLSPNEKRLLELHHFEGFGLEEIAKDLGIEHEAARKRHSRLIIKLKRCLESQSARGWS